MLVVRWA